MHSHVGLALLLDDSFCDRIHEIILSSTKQSVTGNSQCKLQTVSGTIRSSGSWERPGSFKIELKKAHGANHPTVALC